MIDRVNFLESVQGIQYPDMLANFFDHFIALKALVSVSMRCHSIVGVRYVLFIAAVFFSHLMYYLTITLRPLTI